MCWSRSWSKRNVSFLMTVLERAFSLKPCVSCNKHSQFSLGFFYIIFFFAEIMWASQVRGARAGRLCLFVELWAHIYSDCRREKTSYAVILQYFTSTISSWVYCDGLVCWWLLKIRSTLLLRHYGALVVSSFSMLYLSFIITFTFDFRLVGFLLNPVNPKGMPKEFVDR